MHELVVVGTGRDRGDRPFAHSLRQLGHRVPRERPRQHHHLEKHDADGPDVGLLREVFASPHLGSKVVRGVAVQNRFLVVLREPKVADLDEPITREEDVGRFDVAVEKPFGVNVVELEAYLREVTCDLPRRERDDPCAEVVAEVPAVGVLRHKHEGGVVGVARLIRHDCFFFFAFKETYIFTSNENNLRRFSMESIVLR